LHAAERAVVTAEVWQTPIDKRITLRITFLLLLSLVQLLLVLLLLLLLLSVLGASRTDLCVPSLLLLLFVLAAINNSVAADNTDEARAVLSHQVRCRSGTVP
jgi:hypothetical protein